MRPRKCWGYCRASTVDQEDTLHIQEAATRRAWEYRYQEKGIEWCGTFVDRGVSGEIPFRSRPAGQLLMRELEAGDIVIVTKLDRGFRDVRDCLDTVEFFGQLRIGLLMLDLEADTTTAIGKLIVTIAAAVSAFERERISERMREFQAKRRAEGRPSVGNAPYGFKCIGKKGHKKFAPDEYTRSVGRLIVEWMRGGSTFEGIYYHMIRQGIRTLHNKEWSVGSIKRAYAGEILLQQKEASSDGTDNRP
jgi:DNA invertase Pin-like site-specific DNA recombinase